LNNIAILEGQQLILKVLKDLNCSPHIIEHSKAVSKKARALSQRFEVDLKLIEMGSILHDVGRSKTNNISHGIVGADILKKLGFSQEIVNITEKHIGAGIPKEEAVLLGLPFRDFLPLTMEEKIVAHADNLIHGTKEIEIDFVIDKWKMNLGNYKPSLERLIKLHQEIVGNYG
jgi:TIGR00295 family protein